ncbi:MAG TPA: hypothetical protein VGH52_11590 [Gaiellaceae bacterium]|jgi:hypothetical protein
MTRAPVLIVLVGFLALAGVGFRAAPSSGIINFASAPRAPQSARSTFTRNTLLPKSIVRRLKLSQTRRVATEVFPGMSERLFVAPATRGDYCYEWVSALGSTWLAEFSACDVRTRPMVVGYDDTRISIMANKALVEVVRAKLSNGSEAQLALHWVSAPISAGFLLYQPPKGLQVTQIEALKGTSVVETDPITAIP